MRPQLTQSAPTFDPECATIAHQVITAHFCPQLTHSQPSSCPVIGQVTPVMRPQRAQIQPRVRPVMTHHAPAEEAVGVVAKRPRCARKAPICQSVTLLPKVHPISTRLWPAIRPPEKGGASGRGTLGSKGDHQVTQCGPKRTHFAPTLRPEWERCRDQLPWPGIFPGMGPACRSCGANPVPAQSEPNFCPLSTQLLRA